MKDPLPARARRHLFDRGSLVDFLCTPVDAEVTICEATTGCRLVSLIARVDNRHEEPTEEDVHGQETESDGWDDDDDD